MRVIAIMISLLLLLEVGSMGKDVAAIRAELCKKNPVEKQEIKEAIKEKIRGAFYDETR